MSVGYNALFNIFSNPVGSGNIGLGVAAGQNIINSNNICIGNDGSWLGRPARVSTGHASGFLSSCNVGCFHATHLGDHLSRSNFWHFV